MNTNEKPLQNARITHIIPTSRKARMKTSQPKAPNHPNKIYKNFSIDPEVAKLFDLFCEMNRKAGSPSHEVEEHMIRTIEKKGRAYGLRLPERLATK